MSFWAKINSGLALAEVERMLRDYPAKHSLDIKRYDRDTVIKYTEKIGNLDIPFSITYCRQKFATISAGTEVAPGKAPYFDQLKQVFDLVKNEADSLYGPAYYINNKCETYEELVRLDLKSTMTSGLPNDRYVAIMENIWKIKKETANLAVFYDYHDYMNLNFYYSVKNPFG